MARRAVSRIGLRLGVPALAVVLVSVAALVYVQRRGAAAQGTEVRDAYADLLGRVVVRQLRESMLAKDRPRIQRQLEGLGEVAPIRSVRICDVQGRVVFASDPAQVGSQLDPHGPELRPWLGEPAGRRTHTSGLVAEDGRRLHRTLQPVRIDRACQRCHDEPEGAVVGVLLADLDDDALTGRLRADSDRIVWGVALSALGGVLLLAALLWRQVLARLRTLRHLLDLLRSGARASVLAVGSADEIDDVTRSVQALTLDLDGRVGLERASRRLAPVFERHPGPVRLVDLDGRVLAANRPALLATGTDRRCGLVGRPWLLTPDELRERAWRDGWALADDSLGPALAGLDDAAGEPLAVLELWPEGATLPEAPPDAGSDDPDWQLYGAVALEAVAARESSGPSRRAAGAVLRLDARLGQVRRLAADVVGLAQEALAEREELDLKSLVLLATWDVQRALPQVRWHTALDPAERVIGQRYALRVLIERLARAAGRQAGPGGQVIVFTQADLAGTGVYLGAWASRPERTAAADAEAVLVDPAPGPPLARAVARAHGGDLEVDPGFSAHDLPPHVAARLSCAPEGSLFVARLARRPVAKARGRGMA